MSKSSQIILTQYTDQKLIQDNKLGKPLDFSFMGVDALKSKNKLLFLNKF